MATPVLDFLTFRNGRGTLRPRGRYTLVEAVDMVSAAIANCRGLGVRTLLVDATGFVDLPIPTLLDRFLMVEDWASEAHGMVTVAMVAPPEYIHPRKFGVKVAHSFGLTCDVYATEEEAAAWLAQAGDAVA
ncbi:MAG: hypothetical protein U1F10_07720 [Burkholderiales bacterium]